jgi:hypothetical protein
MVIPPYFIDIEAVTKNSREILECLDETIKECGLFFRNTFSSKTTLNF